ncbi:MAG: sigma-70 family RNA polymerase sigma factor [Myxococcota bacterium]
MGLENKDLEHLFQQYASYVGAIALRLCGRTSEVDDIVQDVFIAAQRGLREIEDPRGVRRWLARVTVRTAQRRMRTLKLKGMIGLVDEPDYNTLAGASASPEQMALISSVYRELDQLPAQQRTAWILRFVEGFRLEEVAELCGCSLATAKRRIASTQTHLRDTLDG